MSPFLSDDLMAFTAASSARPAAAFEISAWLAMASIISDLFTNTPERQNQNATRNRYVRRRGVRGRTLLRRRRQRSGQIANEAASVGGPCQRTPAIGIPFERQCLMTAAPSS